MGSRDIQDSLPDIREGVAAVVRLAFIGEALPAGDPEARILLVPREQEDGADIVMNERRVRVVSVETGAVLAVLEQALRPRPIVVAHPARHEIHSLDIEEDDGPRRETLRCRAANGVVGVDQSAVFTDELSIA